MTVDINGEVKAGHKFCVNCEKVTKHEAVSRVVTDDQEAEETLVCDECGEDWSDSTYAVASGYESNCPHCGQLNRYFERQDEVNCETCGVTFKIYETNHAD